MIEIKKYRQIDVYFSIDNNKFIAIIDKNVICKSDTLSSLEDEIDILIKNSKKIKVYYISNIRIRAKLSNFSTLGNYIYNPDHCIYDKPNTWYCFLFEESILENTSYFSLMDKREEIEKEIYQMNKRLNSIDSELRKIMDDNKIKSF